MGATRSRCSQLRVCSPVASRSRAREPRPTPPARRPQASVEEATGSRTATGWFWIGMKRIWSGWTKALHLVEPATVVKMATGRVSLLLASQEPKNQGGRPRIRSPGSQADFATCGIATQPGANLGSKQSSPNSASRLATRRSRSTGRSDGSRLRRPGGRFSTITSKTFAPSTSLPCPRPPSVFSMCSS